MKQFGGNLCRRKVSQPGTQKQRCLEGEKEDLGNQGGTIETGERSPGKKAWGGS